MPWIPSTLLHRYVSRTCPGRVIGTDVAFQGLARISHHKRLGLRTSTLRKYEPEGGKGVNTYVVDTGINIHHIEFEGRVSWGKTLLRTMLMRTETAKGFTVLVQSPRTSMVFPSAPTL